MAGMSKGAKISNPQTKNPDEAEACQDEYHKIRKGFLANLLSFFVANHFVSQLRVNCFDSNKGKPVAYKPTKK